MATARTNDEKSALFDGVSVSLLAAIFEKDKRTVSQAIRDVEPSGMKGGFPVYRLKDAAPYLVEPVADLEEYLSKLKPQDLPAQLQKDFWAAQLSRQKFELNKGELWPTDKVVLALAEAFKKLKTGVMLFSDTVEARAELNERQRKIINELADALLEELRASLLEGKFDGDEEQPEPAIPELD